MKVLQREHEQKVETLMKKIKTQAKEIATLSKGKSKGSRNVQQQSQQSTNPTLANVSVATAVATNDGGSSGTDSPSVN